MMNLDRLTKLLARGYYPKRRRRIFWGCQHRHTTFPITPKRLIRTPVGLRRGTYVVCLDCGKEFTYSWNEMQMGKEISRDERIRDREQRAPMPEQRVWRVLPGTVPAGSSEVLPEVPGDPEETAGSQA